MKQASGLLANVQVLELAQRISGPYCGKIFAHLGASVIKIEPPTGDNARQLGPFPDHQPHPEQSGLFLWLNANKYGVTLDVHSSVGREHLDRLVKTADILIVDDTTAPLAAWGVDYETMCSRNPGLVCTTITPFGRWGPYADFLASDLVLFHMSGNAHGMLGAVSAPDRDPPIRAGGYQAELVVGMAAATATLAALYRKRQRGVGGQVQISAFEAMVNQVISGLANCAYGQAAPPRDLRYEQEAAIGGMVSAIGGVLPCNDGYVAISPREDAQWERWLDIMGHPAWASDVRFATRQARQQNAPALWTLLGEWSRRYSKHDIARWGQEKRIPCFPVNTVEDLLRDEHLAARHFFVEMAHPVAGPLTYPGVPYTLPLTPLPLAARPAPLLGQHNALFLQG